MGRLVSMYRTVDSWIAGWSKTTGRYISRQGIFMSDVASMDDSRSCTF